MRWQLTRRLVARPGSRVLPSSSESARWLVAGAVVAIACALLGRARDSALDHAARLEVELTRLGDLAAAYQRLTAAPRLDLSASGGPPPQTPVHTIVERATREALQHGHVVSLVPVATDPPSQPAPGAEGGGLTIDERVELRLSGTPLADLVDLLYALERGHQPLQVARLHVRRSMPASADAEGGATLDVIAVLEAPRAGR